MVGEQLGPYTILEEVGRGGMAVVYRARQQSMERDVAVKVVLRGIAGDPIAVQRFQREAKLIARLEHPHILPVYDFDGSHQPPYIVMRYLDSGTLKDVMAQGLLPHHEIAYLLRQVCSALDYAHRQGIIHRDIKPSNILIDREGNAFVTDLGIARLTTSEGRSPITETGVTMGTPDYMSPEQAKGVDNVDYRTDIYALGVMLFEMLAGELPYQAESSWQVLVKHMDDPVPSILEVNPTLPPDIDAVLQRALAKDPSLRYESALDMLAALTGALGVPDVVNPARLREAAGTSIIRRRGKKYRGEDSQTTPAEQNKQVTVLYANLSEFTDILDEAVSDPQEIRQQLWTAVDTIITEYGGIVDNRKGDTALVLWGAKSVSEDDPERAVKAALAIREHIGGIAAQVLPNIFDYLPVQMGIHTGTTLLKREETTRNYTASGQTVNTASRLEQTAPGGTILISNETYQYVRGVFLVEGIDIRPRGSKESLQAYLVNGIKPRAFREAFQGVEGINTKTIGRDAELKQLIDAMETASEDEETQVVTLVGDAGIGKTRLLFELAEWEERLSGDFFYFPAQCSARMQNQPFALMREIFTYRFDIQDNDDLAAVQEKFEGGVAGFLGENSQAQAHRLAHLVGYIFMDSPHIQNRDPQQLNVQGLQDAADIFVTVSKIGQGAVGQSSLGLWLQLENIHYADDRSLDFINQFVEDHPDLRVAVICSARPSLYDRRPTWGSGQDFHTRIDLNLLSKRDSRRLVKEILQKLSDIPDALRDLIVDRSEGNPYYMEELVKMLIDERVIFKGDEFWTFYPDRLSKVRVPVTLTGLVQARLDNLLLEERVALQRASVIGRIFWEDSVQALAAADHMSIDVPHFLQVLTESELIDPREDSAFTGQREYVFKSMVMRDVTYESIIKRQQRNYHYEAGNWLAKMGGQNNDYTLQIAEHYEIAGENVKATEYLYRAGEQALRASAYNEALALFERAVSLIQGQVDVDARRLHVTLNNQIGHILEEQGFYSEAESHLLKNLSLARDLADKNPLMDTLTKLGQVVIRQGKPGLVYLEEALALSRELRNKRGEIQSLMWLSAHCVIILSDFEGSTRHLQAALNLSQSIGDQTLTARIYNMIGEDFRVQTKHEEAIVHYQQALPIYQSLNNLYGICLVLTNLGHSYTGLEKLDKAAEYYRDALRIGIQMDTFFGVPLQEIITGFGVLSAKADNVDHALDLLGLILNYADVAEETRQLAEPTLIILREKLGEKAVHAGLARGAQLDWREVVADLLRP
jgi:serine/threonine protein kinase/tetratricopeptide (TPR) repeat protein